LKSVANNPSFNMNDSVELLRQATRRFVDWLEQEVAVDFWLHSIDAQTTLNISRLSFLKMCGDISKHNFLRAVGVAGLFAIIEAKR
jgi:hypothetical protein